MGQRNVIEKIVIKGVLHRYCKDCREPIVYKNRVSRCKWCASAKQRIDRRAGKKPVNDLDFKEDADLPPEILEAMLNGDFKAFMRSTDGQK